MWLDCGPLAWRKSEWMLSLIRCRDLSQASGSVEMFLFKMGRLWQQLQMRVKALKFESLKILNHQTP